MIGVVEHDDRVASGGQPGHLDGVLDGLRAGVEQRGPLLVTAGGQPVQGLADRDVPVVRRDHKAGVGERSHLLLDRGRDSRVGVAGVDHGDARAEVDERVAVDVDQHATARLVDVHRQRAADPLGHRSHPALVDRERARPGDLGDQATLLGEVGTTHAIGQPGRLEREVG